MAGPSETPSPSPSKPRRRRRGALVAGVVVAVLLFAFVRSRRSSSAQVEATPEVPLGSMYGGAIDPGYSSGPTWTDLSAERLASLEQTVLDLQDYLTVPPPAPTAPDPGEAPLEPPASTSSPPNEQGASGQVPPPAPGNATVAVGAYWNIGGKRTLLTPAVRDSLIRELRSKGVNLAEWARSHPAAVKAVGGITITTGSSGPGPAGPTPPGQVKQKPPQPDPPPKPVKLPNPAKPKKKGKGGKP